jgi:hypothetical protein
MLALVGLVIAPFAFVTSAVAHVSRTAELNGSGTTVLMPGSETSGDFTVPNESDTAADLRVQVVDLAEDDNGCVRPEQQAGDITCASGGGELGSWLRLRLLRIDGLSEQELWTGPLAQLQESVEVGQVAARESLHLRLVIALPRPAPNDTMSDRVSFVLRSTYVGVAAPSTSTAVSVGASTGDGSTFGSLAATGSSVSTWLLVCSLLLAVVGYTLVVQSRPRSGVHGEASPPRPLVS